MHRLFSQAPGAGLLRLRDAGEQVKTVCSAIAASLNKAPVCREGKLRCSFCFLVCLT